MSKLPRICVFGAGAIGTLVAARLAAAGRPVTIVARGARMEDISANGLRLQPGNAPVEHVPVNALSAAEAGVHDVVFLALKTDALGPALSQIAPLLGPETVIVPLMNGVPWWYRQPPEGHSPTATDPDGRIASLFQRRRIIGAVLFLTCALGADGILVPRGPERIVLGPARNDDLVIAAALANLFEDSGIVCASVPNVRRDMWAKVALNLATNPLSVVTDATLEDMFRSDSLSPVLTSVLEETIAVARADGYEPRLTVEEMIAVGTRAGPFHTSMAQDHRRGTPLELSAICRSVFEVADRVGVAMPVARTVHELCKFMARG